MLVYYNLDIIQGSTFSAQLSIKNADGTAVDLNGYNVRGQIKYNYGAASPLVTLNSSQLFVNTAGDLTPASGIIAMKLSDTDTASLPVIMGVYDIETYNNTEVNKVLDGTVKIHPEVTR